MMLYMGLFSWTVFLQMSGNLIANGAMYDAIIDSFEPDSEIDSNYLKLGTLRVTRKKRNCFVITGDFELIKNWGNDNVATYEIKRATGNGPPVMSGKSSFCDLYNSDAAVVDAVRKASSMPPKGGCPIPKGKYTVDGFELKEEDLPMMLPAGQYVVSAKVDSVQGTQVVAYKVYITVK
ncbi:uncharacterized protein LOC129780149 [Toxorhynchites rutilus septentrionalis]|uniref:uncharacterized protein LOC129780149 n=1 Tax=Toxorhynchites rutilus septentrionalis TaxID=329112 RepID=UPI00247A71D7|nr:uncharacterized protein LOC129780149 [Toxorhynchites rutilus septentrionalis]